MRALSKTILVMAGLIMLLPATGTCRVANEIVLYGTTEADRPASTPNYNPQTAEIGLNAITMFRIRSAAVTFSVAERETMITQRLMAAMNRCMIVPVYVDEVRGVPTVYVGRYRIVTAYPVDVRASSFHSAPALAEHWADRIRKGLLQAAPRPCLTKASGHEVSLFGYVFFRIADQRAFPAVSDRVTQIKRRLLKIARDFDPDCVSVDTSTPSPKILYDGEPVITVTRLDTMIHDSTAVNLAKTWAKRISEGMTTVSK